MNNLRKKHETLSLGSDWGRRILQLNSVDSMPAIVFPQLNCGGSPSVPDFSMFQCMACLQTATSSMSLFLWSSKSGDQKCDARFVRSSTMTRPWSEVSMFL